MSRPAVLAFALLLLLLSLTSAARREPSFVSTSSAQSAQVVDEAGDMVVDEGCDGLTDEECLLRRTLLAHTDYIYTNKHNKP